MYSGEDHQSLSTGIPCNYRLQTSTRSCCRNCLRPFAMDLRSLTLCTRRYASSPPKDQVRSLVPGQHAEVEYSRRWIQPSLFCWSIPQAQFSLRYFTTLKRTPWESVAVPQEHLKQRGKQYLRWHILIFGSTTRTGDVNGTIDYLVPKSPKEWFRYH